MAAGRTECAQGLSWQPEAGYRPGAGTGGAQALPSPLGAGPGPTPFVQVPHHDLRWIEVPAAAGAIWHAFGASGPYFGPTVLHETGEALESILEGLFPTLGKCIALVAATSVLGAAAGAAIGALAGGVGAAPGAVIGGQLGYDIGVAALSVLGLGFLAVAIGAHLVELKDISQRAVQRAIDSVHLAGCERDAAMTQAAREFALAEATLVKLILIGIVALLLRRPTLAAVRTAAGSASASAGALSSGEAMALAESNVAGLVATLRASRLGEGFAAWIERNWRGLIRNPRLRPEPAAPVAGPSPGTAMTPSQVARARGAEPSEPASPAPLASEYEQAKAANWKRPDGSTWWPPNDGAAGTPVKATLPEGTPLDRFGSENGSFLSPQGASFESRAMPGLPNAPANNYLVTKPLPVEQATIAPWFDQPGGGIQYKLSPPEGWDTAIDGPFNVAKAKQLGYLADQ